MGFKQGYVYMLSGGRQLDEKVMGGRHLRTSYRGRQLLAEYWSTSAPVAPGADDGDGVDHGVSVRA